MGERRWRFRARQVTVTDGAREEQRLPRGQGAAELLFGVTGIVLLIACAKSPTCC
jgi:hypothetical protein